MDRSTMRFGFPVPALLLALALTPAPAAVFACEDAHTQVITLIATDDAPPTPTPAQPARPARPPRSPHASSTPAPAAPTEAPEAPAPAEAPEAPEATLLEVPAPPSMLTPRGWFGFGFECEKYENRPATRDSAAFWRFYTRPWVYSVQAGSPAAKAGLQRGDIIVALDGVSILNPAAGRRFGRIKPNETVRWTVSRDGERRTLVATAGERPGRSVRVQILDMQRDLKRLREQTDNEDMRRSIDEIRREVERQQREQTPSPTIQTFRYAGVIGSAEVEVRGNEAPIVSTDGNEMVITIGNSVVKIRTADVQPKRKAKTPK